MTKNRTRYSVLPTLAKAWWSDPAAEICASFNWLLILLVFFVSSIAISIPFAANRWREAHAASRASAYPGLGTAFEHLAAKDIHFVVQRGTLIVPIEQAVLFETKDWTIQIGDVQESQRNDLSTSHKKSVLIFSPESLLISSQTSGQQVAASLKNFEGFSSEILRKAAGSKRDLAVLIESLLFRSAFAGLPSILLSIILMMTVQNLAFVVMLGLMLSFAVYRGKLGKKDTRSLKPAEGIKMATAIMAGPAFLIGLAGLFIPAFKAPVLWLAYSLLAGIRVILLYTSRYRTSGRS
ncbi:MAG: hypothetical protein SNJ56_05905 [Termitinemataceae bacterium]